MDDDHRTPLRVCGYVIEEDESARCLDAKGLGDAIAL